MLEHLYLARYRFVLQCLSAMEFRQFAGATVRGAFGAVFRRLVCITRAPTCEGCLLRQQCAYGYVFDTAPPPGAERLRRYESVPRPYVLDIASDERTSFAEGDALQLELTLVGRATDYLPYFVYTCQKLEESGLGTGRHEGKGRFRLTEVLAHAADGSLTCVYTPEEGLDTLRLPVIRGADILARVTPARQVRVRFLTPTRLRFEGRLTDDIDFHHLIRALLHRLSSLVYFHCHAEPEADFTGLIQQAEGVRTLERNLHWREQSRYSRRQQSVLKMGGFTGEMLFEGDLRPFLPLLKAGEYVHVGKGTVMGLGRIETVCEEVEPNA